MFKDKKISIPIYWPSKGLSLDNAAMIAGLAYQKFLLNPLIQNKSKTELLIDVNKTKYMVCICDYFGK